MIIRSNGGIDILENQSSIEVVRIKSNGNHEDSFLELKDAHAYQVSAARDEVPKIFQVDKEFLAKTPIITTNSINHHNNQYYKSLQPIL